MLMRTTVQPASITFFQISEFGAVGLFLQDPNGELQLEHQGKILRGSPLEFRDQQARFCAKDRRVGQSLGLGVLVQQPVALELFAGTGSLSKALRAAGFQTFALDHHVAHAKVPILKVDLVTFEGQGLVWQLLQSSLVCYVSPWGSVWGLVAGLGIGGLLPGLGARSPCIVVITL